MAARKFGFDRLFSGELTRQIGHLDGGEAGIETFVAAFQAGAIDGLLERVAGENAKDHGHARIELGELHAARDFVANIFEVRGFAANHAADADDGVATARLREFFRGDRNFKRAGNANDFDLFFRGAGAFERVECSGEKTVGDELLKRLTTIPKCRPAAESSPVMGAGWSLPTAFSFARAGFSTLPFAVIFAMRTIFL